MNQDSARKRRALYQRSLTLPAGNIAEDDDGEELVGLLPGRGTVSSLPSTPSDSISSRSSACDRKQRIRTGNNNQAESTSSLRRSRPRPLVRRNTVISGDPLIEQADKSATHTSMLEPGHSISRSFSTPSVILNKVREKIRRHVVQTSDWPPPSSVLREHYGWRRNSLPEKNNPPFSQRSEPKLETIQLTDTGLAGATARLRVTRSPRAQRYRRKSPPSTERSLSETFVKTPPGGGVVCSKDDLRAIMFEFKDTTTKRGKLQKSKTVTTPPCESPSVLSVRSQPSFSSRFFKKQVNFEGGEEGLAHSPEISTTPKTSREPSPPLPATVDEFPEVMFPDIFVGDRIEEAPKPLMIQTQTTNAYYDLKASLDGDANPSVVKDIVFDEHGQTWEVYGADFDPEIVGEAIQRHLNSMIKRNHHASSSSSLSSQEYKRPRRIEVTQGGKATNVQVEENDVSQTDSATSRSLMRWFCLFGRND